MRFPPLHEFVLRDAAVHGADGIVTVGGRVIEETLAHIPLGDLGFEAAGDRIGFPLANRLGRVERALHVMGGSHANYFHWLTEIVPRLQAAPLRPGGEAGLVLLPPLRSAAQADLIGVIAAAGHPHLAMPEGMALDVGRLRFVPNLAGFGFAPHPLLGPVFDALQRALRVAPPCGRRFYVERRDSDRRPLANEAELVALVQSHGFEAVALAGQSLATQASLFAGASHIVAPHGAGLANLVFCRPGTVVCELHMDQYVHWCFRRLAALRGLRYGCLIGPADDEPLADGWAHHLRWTAPLDRLRSVLEAPAFRLPAVPQAIDLRADGFRGPEHMVRSVHSNAAPEDG